MNSFLKSFSISFIGAWIGYFGFMLLINILLWFCWNETKELYQPVWNIFNLI